MFHIQNSAAAKRWKGIPNSNWLLNFEYNILISEETFNFQERFPPHLPHPLVPDTFEYVALIRLCLCAPRIPISDSLSFSNLTIYIAALPRARIECACTRIMCKHSRIERAYAAGKILYTPGLAAAWLSLSTLEELGVLFIQRARARTGRMSNSRLKINKSPRATERGEEESCDRKSSPVHLLVTSADDVYM